jgi:hypothetical protein
MNPKTLIIASIVGSLMWVAIGYGIYGFVKWVSWLSQT